jgi:hypothetical protein
MEHNSEQYVPSVPRDNYGWLFRMAFSTLMSILGRALS